jgi:alpha-tubulin suppressor-like RCC1 family protein
VVVAVACGECHTCAVTSTGSVFEWGSGLRTRFGNNDVLKPKLLRDFSFKCVISVSANHIHTACVTKAGEVFTWGDGNNGKLGHGDSRNQEIPKRVEALVGVKAKEVSCGGNHTAVCTEDGHVYNFGYGWYGQLGHGDRQHKASPVLVQALDNVTHVQCGHNHTMALTSSGYVFTWGEDQDMYFKNQKKRYKRILDIPIFNFITAIPITPPKTSTWCFLRDHLYQGKLQKRSIHITIVP